MQRILLERAVRRKSRGPSFFIVSKTTQRLSGSLVHSVEQLLNRRQDFGTGGRHAIAFKATITQFGIPWL